MAAKEKVRFGKACFIVMLFVGIGSFSMGLLCFPLAREWKGRIQERFRPSTEPKDLRHWNDKCAEFEGLGRTRPIVFLGDSRIEEVNWSELLDRCDISNRGIGWDTTTGLLRRLTGVLPHNVDYCVIQIGINDILQGSDIASLIGRFSTILEHITARTHARPIVFSIIMAGVGQDALNAKVRASNQQLAALCNASGIRFVDLNAVLCPDGFLAQEFTRDGIHLNWKGCLQFRKILAPHLPTNSQQSQTN